MDGQPTFDAARSAAMKTMLMKVAGEHTTPPRTKRIALIVSLTVGALLLAGGGAAWAITGMPLFQAPAPAPVVVSPSPSVTPTRTPTPKPAPAPSPIADPGPPYSTVPVDCATLAARAGLDSIVSNPKLSDVTKFDDPGVIQSGVLDCNWLSSGLQLLVSTDTSTGSADIADQRKVDASNPDIGDLSALRCIEIHDCTVSVISGSYWLNVRATSASDATSIDRATRSARGFTEALAQTPQPRAPWTSLPTSWSTVTDCSQVTTEPPVPQFLGSPLLTGPQPVVQGTMDSISFHENQSVSCAWGPPSGVAIPAGSVRSVSLSITPGAVWAYPTWAAGGMPVTVAGAQEASFVCGNPEALCILYLVTDNTLMQLTFNESTPDLLDKMEAFAAALIAQHSR